MKRDSFLFLRIAAILALASLGTSRAATELFHDDFQSGDLDKWQSLPVGSEPLKVPWTVVADPDVADPSQKVLCTPEMGTQLYIYHIEPRTVMGSGLILSVRFNADAANREWKTTWSLSTKPILNGAYLVDGYSVRMGFSGKANDLHPTLAISRVDGDGKGAGTRTDLATATLPDDAFQPGWNDFQLVWKSDGTLKVILNGAEVVSANDTAFEPTFRTLSLVTWLSNNMQPPNSLPEGRKLYFDEIKVNESDL